MGCLCIHVLVCLFVCVFVCVSVCACVSLTSYTCFYAIAQSPGREAALAWASLAQRFPASRLLTRVFYLPLEIDD